MSSPDNDTSQGKTRTFFYVFADKSLGLNHSAWRDEALSPSSNSEPGRSLDSTVKIAFDRFDREFRDDAKVDFNPQKYHSIRKAFGIQQLPAFGVADQDLTNPQDLPSDPPKLPSRWNPLSRGERKRILASEKFLPKVERAVISHYASADDLYHFLRDLHISNIDQGLQAVVQKIENEVLAIGGKRLLQTVSIGKKVVVGW